MVYAMGHQQMQYDHCTLLPTMSQILTGRKRYIEEDALTRIGVTQPHVRLSGAMTVNTVSMAHLGSSFYPPTFPQ